MTLHSTANNYSSTISSAITATDQLTMTLVTLPLSITGSALGFPYWLTIGENSSTGEIVSVTSLVSGTTVNILRAEQNTTAQTFISGTKVELNETAGNIEEIHTELSGFASTILATVLTGLSTATNAVISATDTILSALGKLQKQISDNLTTLTNHTGNTSNPHSVTATQVSLGNVTNESKATMFTSPTFTGTPTAPTFTSNIAIGTAPLTVTSTTKVTNLNSDQVDGHDAGTSANNVLVLDSGGLVPTANIPTVPLAQLINTPHNLFQQSLINPNFDIWQRGTSFALTTATNNYTSDRWRIAISAISSGTLTVSQDTTQIEPLSSYCMKLDFTSSVGAVLSLNQILEAINSQKLRNQLEILSFRAKAVGTIGTLSTSARIIDGTNSNAYPSTSTANTTSSITLTSSWQTFSVSKTIQSGANSISFDPLVITQGDFTGQIYISQVVANVGTVVLPFMPKSYDNELVACYRYFKRLVGASNSRYVGMGQAYSTTQISALIFAGCYDMRIASPTVSVVGLVAALEGNNSWAVNNMSSTTNLLQNGIISLSDITATTGTPFTQSASYEIKLNTAGTSYIDITAEL